MRFQFDEFVIDGDRRLVTRGSDEIHVAPKTFDCLLVLLAQAPNAVSKAELMAALWPGTHVADATLNGVVADAREALGDTGRNPRAIRTLHRFGYAFIGQIERFVSASSSEPVLGWLIADTWRLPLRSGETVLGREGEAWSHCRRRACRASTPRSSWRERQRGCAIWAARTGPSWTVCASIARSRCATARGCASGRSK